MILEVDPASVIPPYEQLRQQVTALVRAGVLTSGTRLRRGGHELDRACRRPAEGG